jgi:predicted metal-binding membrane protein
VTTVPDRTLLESALRHDRTIVLTALTVATVLSWSWILAMSLDMYGSMTGASAWTMTTDWDTRHLLLLFAMWAVMMVAMMLPSMAPLLLIYAGVVRRSADATHTTVRVYVLALGYLVVWILFSAAATAWQRLLAESLILSPMMQVDGRALAGALLVAVGAYQLTPLKGRCLDACRSPVQLVTRYWKPGTGGAFRMGVAHGMTCLGCCWALMLLLFVGGVMNLAVIAALTAFVAFEKLTPFGAQTSRISGVVLIAAAIWMVVA